MVLAGDSLQLSPRPDNRTPHTPIDGFFASLAAGMRDRGHCRGVVGHRVGRRDRHSRGQVGRRHHLRANARIGEVRRHAARGHRHGHGRRGDDARRNRRRVVADRAPSARAAGGARRAPQGRRRTIAAGLRPAAAGQRRGLPPLQAADRPPPVIAPHGAAPHRRRRSLRRAAREDAGRSARPVPGFADSRHELFSRARVVRGAGGRGVSQAARPGRSGSDDPGVGVRVRQR